MEKVYTVKVISQLRIVANSKTEAEEIAYNSFQVGTAYYTRTAKVIAAYTPASKVI